MEIIQNSIKIWKTMRNKHPGRTGIIRENNNKERLPLRTRKETKYRKNMNSNTVNKNTAQNCKYKNNRSQLYCLPPFLTDIFPSDNKYRWKDVVLICKCTKKIKMNAVRSEENLALSMETDHKTGGCQCCRQK
jgi:hypothetical protein